MRSIAALVLTIVASVAQATSLEAIQKKGEIVIGVKDSSPPFSMMDTKTRSLKGYDIDFALGIAKRLNVKPVFKIVESDERIPHIKNDTVDIVVADLTRTAEREREVDFSVGYFVTDDRIMAKKGRFKSEADLAGAAIAVTATSSTSKKMKKNLPNTPLVEFEDKPEMVKALQSGSVAGVAADGPVLSAFLARMPAAQRSQYEISEFALEVKTIAVGMQKGEKKLQEAINQALVEMENSGEAVTIFNRWFGPQTAMPMMRIFKISNRRF
ncbi:transporter substrate-binding domain-containing protein [Chitinibacter sp. GC72]|uniref:transporter substrate-binding domain-containing protein n=1 Tax=Chitinibacter sp. GC72 TaxID=1526917 RepID=UPI0012F8C0F7|nr:transporter substrate-binding domain-containing protein [Chitinibacter sp. GC72]